MKMSKPGLCCDNCFGSIACRSTSCARLWLDLCDIQNNTSSPFGLQLEDFPALRLLEVLGFVVTSENPHMIVVKVLGRQEDAYGAYFCGGKCNG